MISTLYTCGLRPAFVGQDFHERLSTVVLCLLELISLPLPHEWLVNVHLRGYSVSYFCHSCIICCSKSVFISDLSDLIARNSTVCSDLKTNHISTLSSQWDIFFLLEELLRLNLDIHMFIDFISQSW